MTKHIAVSQHKQFSDDGNLKKGETYVRLGLTYREVYATQEEALNLAHEILVATGLPVTIIDMRKKRDDLLVRTPVDAPNTKLDGR